jgi:predicted GH43/DUF377 family glycosyl hydrolase
MHKIALEPKDSYELSADSSGAGVLDSKDPTKMFDCFRRPVLSPKSAEERIRVANNIVFPCRVVNQLIGG